MPRLETSSELIFFAVLSLAVGALGALMLLFPLERLPEDRASYTAVVGILREVRDESPRRATSIVFALEGREPRFVSRFPPTREDARTWVVGQTRLAFLVRRQPAEGNPGLIPVYGLRVDARQLKSLKEDVDFHNAGVNPWGGLLALAIGTLGVVVTALRWHQRRAA